LAQVDKVVNLLEKVSLIWLVIAFGGALIAIVGDMLLSPGIALESENVILIPILSLCPAGIFTLLVQLFVILPKRPLNRFRIFILVASIMALPLGCFFEFAFVQSQH
ncbi:MAG TPA: hypothetical protein VMC85_09820, partial [Desulfomonilaceae bacterium]|nr:hypothetical protein [Desulfomonilaceae bacterium]